MIYIKVFLMHRLSENILHFKYTSIVSSHLLHEESSSEYCQDQRNKMTNKYILDYNCNDDKDSSNDEFQLVCFFILKT